MAEPATNESTEPSDDAQAVAQGAEVDDAALDDGGGAVNDSRGWLGDAWHRLRKNRMAVICLVITLAIFGLCCLYALPHLLIIEARTMPAAEEGWQLGFSDTWDGLRVRYLVDPDHLPVFYQDYTAVHNVGGEARAPSTAHWLGTDAQGRDMLARSLFGGFISFLVGICATSIATVIGVVWGAVAGYAGGVVDNVLMRTVDVLYGLPFLLVIILLKVIVDGKREELTQQGYHVSEWWSFGILFVLLGGYAWLTMARIARGQVLAAKHADYVMAARAAGAKPGRVLFRHILPNVLGPLIIYATLSVPQVILLESFLSFLGLGISAPHCSWGTLVADGRALVYPHVSAPWVLAAPASLMVVTLLALNFLGDGIRDAIDPRMR